MTDILFLGQLIESMADAVVKLEQAKKIDESNNVKEFIMKLQQKIKEEIAR